MYENEDSSGVLSSSNPINDETLNKEQRDYSNDKKERMEERSEQEKKSLFERFKPSKQDKKNQPLFIVNGIEMPSSPIIRDLKPDDIESMTVLNEKHQIQKYGDKGKNGVVLITLKKKETKN